MAQKNALSDVRILEVGGIQLPGLLTLPETGYEHAPIEVPELGYIRLIASGTRKLKEIEVEFLCKRDNIVVKYINDWESKNDNRDVIMWYTDKTADRTNAYRRDVFPDCELGDVVSPAYDEASKIVAKIKFKLYPYKLLRTTL